MKSSGATSVSFLLVGSIIALGISAGIGVTTFVYARGASYLSNDPAACANCHVMNQVYEGWMKGGHQHVAVCNDCHVPHNFIGKWLTKMENGMHHSWLFTFSKSPLTIHARPASQEVVQANCVRCHSAGAGHAAGLGTGNQQELSCISCHRSVGHKG